MSIGISRLPASATPNLGYIKQAKKQKQTYKQKPKNKNNPQSQNRNQNPGKL